MYEKMELIIDNFYKTYYKMEEINLSLAIKCLTTTELHIIECIGLEKITIKDLSQRLGITMGTTSTAVNKLEEKKFLNRTRSKSDKRKVYVSLITLLPFTSLTSITSPFEKLLIDSGSKLSFKDFILFRISSKVSMNSNNFFSGISLVTFSSVVV